MAATRQDHAVMLSALTDGMSCGAVRRLEADGVPPVVVLRHDDEEHGSVYSLNVLTGPDIEQDTATIVVLRHVNDRVAWLPVSAIFEGEERKGVVATYPDGYEVDLHLFVFTVYWLETVLGHVRETIGGPDTIRGRITKQN